MRSPVHSILLHLQNSVGLASCPKSIVLVGRVGLLYSSSAASNKIAFERNWLDFPGCETDDSLQHLAGMCSQQRSSRPLDSHIRSATS